MKLFLIFIHYIITASYACETSSVFIGHTKSSCQEIIDVKIENICLSNEKKDRPEISLENESLISKFIQDYRQIYKYEFKGLNFPNLYKTNSCNKNDKKCLEKIRSKNLQEIFKKIKKTSEWKNSVRTINSYYKTSLKKIKSTVENGWSFKLTLSENSTVNKILSKLKESPMSTKSSKKLRHYLGNFSNIGVNILSIDNDSLTDLDFELDEINGYFTNRTVYPYFTIYHLLSKVNITPGLVILNIDSENELLISLLIAHEISHAFTHHSLDDSSKLLSKETLDTMVENLNSCLYEQDKVKKKRGEDIADMLAIKIIDERRNLFTTSKIDSLFKYFCADIDEEEHSKDHGHSPSRIRLYNFFKYSKSLQQHFDCIIESNVCEINTTQN